MPQYTLHLPDGTEYGPVDLATLQAWRQEGRIPKEALVWKEGTPDWVSADALLGDLDEATVAIVPGPSPAPSPAKAAVAADRRVPAAPNRAPAAVATPAAAPAQAANLASPAVAPSDNRRTRSSRAVGAAAADAPPASAVPRAILFTVVGLVVVGLIVAGVVAFMLPALQKRRAMAEIQRYALPDRTLNDAATGLVLEIPQGWV